MTKQTISLVLGSGGFVSGEKLMQKLQSIVGDAKIEDLDIKFTAVVTDIDAQKEVWINKGSLLDVIRASISLPLFFTPFTYKDKRLVDGGVLNPVPISPTFHDSTDLTISVNLGGESTTESPLKEDTPQNSIQKIINKISIPDSFTEGGMYSIANKSFETMQSNIAKMKLAAYPSDIKLDIPINLCGTFEFNKAKELIEYGYNVCEQSVELKEHNGKSI